MSDKPFRTPPGWKRWCPGKGCRQPVVAYRDHDLTCMFCDKKTLPLEDERWHGTLNGYKHYGCRCPGCREAQRAHSLAYQARLRPEDAPHGTRTGYVNYGCRCAECCAVNSAYDRERKRKAA